MFSLIIPYSRFSSRSNTVGAQPKWEVAGSLRMCFIAEDKH